MSPWVAGLRNFCLPARRERVSQTLRSALEVANDSIAVFLLVRALSGFYVLFFLIIV